LFSYVITFCYLRFIE